MAVLGHPFAGTESDEEQFRDAINGLGGADDVVQVDGGGAQTAVGGFGEAVGVAAECQDVVGGDAVVEEVVDGEGAELAGRADDREGHRGSLPSWGRGQLLMAGARPT
ncbi:hypothetical protein QBL21_01280 [Streptomyces sp. 184]